MEYRNYLAGLLLELALAIKPDAMIILASRKRKRSEEEYSDVCKAINEASRIEATVECEHKWLLDTVILTIERRLSLLSNIEEPLSAEEMHRNEGKKDAYKSLLKALYALHRK